MRRFAVLVLLAMISGFGVPVAFADEGLESYLREAATAEFHGREVVVSSWGRDAAADTYAVDQTAGMSRIHSGGAETILSGGRVVMRRGQQWYGLQVTEWSQSPLDERYAMDPPLPARRLGREAVMVRVLENGRPRARIVFDVETSAPLLVEVLDGDGDLFRMAAMVEFTPGRPDMPPSMPTMDHAYMVVPGTDAGHLSDALAGYRRADTYVGPDATIHAFYTDGLFAFSVFEARRGQMPEIFDTAREFESGGHGYRRIVNPSEVWVLWNAPDRSYILVGDLPPDHIEAALAELPRPGNRNPLVRLWRTLFG
ncbi:MAG: hypothetical protein ACE5KX_03400 [Acidimicrobiia bacterium]